MVEVGKIQYLQIQAFGARLAPRSHSLGDFGWGAAQAIVAQFARLASECCCPPFDFGLVGADADDERCRIDELVRISIDGCACGPDTAGLLDEELAVTNGVLNSAAYLAASAGVRFGPPPPMTMGGAS